MAGALSIRNLDAWYIPGKTVLSGLSMELKQNEVLGLMGLNEDHSFPYFTFCEYLSYVFRAYGKQVPEMGELIRGFGFEAYEKKLLGDLSMGNRKKAFLITAFALKPELLFLDEPVNGLDFSGTEFLYRQMKGYGSYGTLLFSSHVLESIIRTADRVVVLENGCIGQSFEGKEIDAVQIRNALKVGEDV